MNFSIFNLAKSNPYIFLAVSGLAIMAEIYFWSDCLAEQIKKDYPEDFEAGNLLFQEEDSNEISNQKEEKTELD